MTSGYLVFSLSLRDVEPILAERGIVVSYETVRRRNSLRVLPIACATAGHGQETSGISTKCFIRIQGVQHDLWSEVDQDGVVLDILVQPQRDSNAANQFFERLLKGLQYVP
jgi:putative transposase